jgi:hypothetical protein
MPFNKAFFEDISDLRAKYFKIYPCGMITLTIAAYGKEYNVATLIECGESMLSFAYYSAKEKAHDLTKQAQEKTGHTKAFPALSIPYEVILSVEMVPGHTEGPVKDQIGFFHENRK